MLDQNHPNPFNPSTTVSFSLSSPSHASLKIYDASGRFVRTLLDEQCSAGTHEKNWDGRDESGREVSSGVYFCRIAAGDFTETRKMVLLR
jgi:flagellar hook assembly protein FlgD